jgi:hypothetical protein
VCVAIGLLSFLGLALRGSPILGLLTALFYWLGGMGVREHSQPAAVLVASAYLLNLLASIAQGVPPGLLTLAAAVLLIANVRGTFIAAKWAAQGDPEAMPERMSETFSDKLVDQMPRTLWPKTRVVFFVIGILYLLLTVLGAVMLAMGLPRRTQAARQPQRPHAMLNASPTR